MARCPAHGNRIQLNPSGAVNLFGATPQPDCRRTGNGAVAEVVVLDAVRRSALARPLSDYAAVVAEVG
jgi:hypothetical protein